MPAQLPSLLLLIFGFGFAALRNPQLAITDNCELFDNLHIRRFESALWFLINSAVFLVLL